MNCVLDVSFAAAIALPDEHDVSAKRFAERMHAEDVIWVPALWWYELANTLLVAERHGRLIEADVHEIHALFRSLKIETDDSGGPEALERLHALAQKHHLTAYDAAYLELAARRRLPLATLDKTLARAAHKSGVSIYK